MITVQSLVQLSQIQKYALILQKIAFIDTMIDLA